MLMCVCHMFIKVLTYLLIKVVVDCKSLVAKQLDENQFALSSANSFAFAVVSACSKRKESGKKYQSCHTK